MQALKGDPRIIKPLMEPAVLANLAGQMHVRLVEMHKRAHLMSRWAGLSKALSGVKLDSGPAFLDMTFEQALDFWRSKGGDPAILDEVLGAYRQQAAASGDLMLDTISQRAVDAIARTIEDGGTLQDFKDAIEAGGTDAITSPISDDYLDLVFRTNVMGSYGAGRYAQLQDPDVIAARPYRQWRTMEDERVREEHAVADGMVWRADDPAFSNVAAPAGFRCRCLVVSGDQEDLASWGGAVESAPRSGFVITPGFGAEAFASQIFR